MTPGLRALGLGIGLALGACFSPPDDAVLFACDAESAPACPDGYACEADGCCHRDGSDVEAHAGECHSVASGTGALSAGTGIPTTGSDTGGNTGGSDTSTGSTTNGGSGGDSGSDTGTAGSSG